MNKITSVHARQILDSRGNPTIEVDILLDNNAYGRGISPSGASTGILEALELRDGVADNYMGKSVYNAVENVNSIIKNTIINQKHNQETLDKMLIDLDGSENKKNLGANTILAVSLAFAHAYAQSLNVPLYKTFSNKDFSLPVPMMNIINGGAHANNNLDFQEFMILPVGFDSFSDSLRAGVEIFHSLKNILNKCSLATSVGDEGGFAPDIATNSKALELILDSIEKSGYKSGDEVYLGLDVASSEFYKDDKYMMTDGKTYNSAQFCDYLESLCNDFPIISIEDGMSENDWVGWRNLTSKLNDKIQLVGDDIFVTNKNIFQKGIDKKVANAILIKFNQIGTVSETLDTINLARDNGYNYIISHRSGETEDVTIADMSVGTSSSQIKTGSLSRSDRVSKYNQLLRIEEQIGKSYFNKNNVFERWLS